MCRKDSYGGDIVGDFILSVPQVLGSSRNLSFGEGKFIKVVEKGEIVLLLKTDIEAIKKFKTLERIGLRVKYLEGLDMLHFMLTSGPLSLKEHRNIEAVIPLNDEVVQELYQFTLSIKELEVISTCERETLDSIVRRKTFSDLRAKLILRKELEKRNLTKPLINKLQ